VRAAHVGCVRHDGAVEAVAIWFETYDGVARADDRRTVLAILDSAAGAARAGLAARPIPAIEPAPSDDAPTRTFDPTDPRLDPVTGLLTPAAFDEHVAEFDGDRATILLIDLTDLDGVASAWGDAVADAALLAVADRLVSGCRRNDVIARVGHDRIAILLGDIDRPSVLDLGRRLVARIADELPVELGPSHLSATVALAHQDGLVDLEEMLESLDVAVEKSRLTGNGRLVLAA